MTTILPWIMGTMVGENIKILDNRFIDNKEIIKTKDMINLVYSNTRFIESDILILGTKMDRVKSSCTTS